jgi:NAD(P)H-nitrite reductase large subunit
MRHVIVGGGVAGTTAAEELRKLDANADITVVSEEEHPLYSRVLLPHYVKEKVPRERVFLKKETWYQEQNIEWLRGVRVESLDVRNKHVALSDGREPLYDKLLIVTGGDVRTIPGDSGEQVSYFRTLDDADHLRWLFDRSQEGDAAAVYGGGFIACEYINMFAHFHRLTSVGLRGPWFWSRVFDEQTGELVNEWMRSHGVNIVTNIGFDEFTANLRNCEPTVLGIGVGITPDFSWIKEAGIETNMGIRADAFLRTNIPDIFTAGDIAEFYDPIVKRHINVGNWMSAMTHGRVVAKNMLGEAMPVKLVSSYATNVLGLEMIFVGDVERGAADEILVKGSKEAGGITQLFARGGVVVGATIVGRNADRAVVTKAIELGRLATEVAAELSF